MNSVVLLELEKMPGNFAPVDEKKKPTFRQKNIAENAKKYLTNDNCYLNIQNIR